MPDIEVSYGNTDDEPCFKVMMLREMSFLCHAKTGSSGRDGLARCRCKGAPPFAEGRTHKEFVSPVMATVWTPDMIPKRVNGVWAPGEWTKIVEDPRLCGRGWHLWRLGPSYQLFQRDVDAMRALGHRHVLFRAEGRGGYINGQKKRVFQQIRLLAPINRLSLEPMRRRPVWWMR